MKIAVHQMCSSTDIRVNAAHIATGIADAGKAGAYCYFAPEMSGLIDRDRARSAASITIESQTLALNIAREAAKAAGIWAHLGSLPISHEIDAGYYYNRSFIIDAQGEIVARYDKIHLFDVALATGESWRESSAYKAGDKAVLADSPLGAMGLAICYDMRFPDLFSTLARGGARVFAVPAAFTVPTGAAHWHVLLRARAIESAAFVIAAAQSGQHADGRKTYGHSLVVDPWGEVLLDMGQEEGLGFADLDMARVDSVRAQIPVDKNRRDISRL